MKWSGNTLVSGRDLFTVHKDGTLEIRGPGWEGKKRKGDTDMTDRPRVCRLGNEQYARLIAEMVADMTFSHHAP